MNARITDDSIVISWNGKFLQHKLGKRSKKQAFIQFQVVDPDPYNDSSFQLEENIERHKMCLQLQSLIYSRTSSVARGSRDLNE